MGFVGKKSKEHSNQSSLYLTLSPLTLFDTSYSECGRVLSSLRPLEYVDLSSLKIADVIPLFSYQKKSEFLKKQLLEKRCKFFKKKIVLKNEFEFENFIFETIENEEQYLTGPEQIHISNIKSANLLIKLRDINLRNLKNLHFTNCKLSKNLFKKLLKESDYIPRLSELSLENITIDQWCFSVVCKLKLDSLILKNILLKNSKIRLFPLLCLESEFFPNLKTLTIHNNVTIKDLDILNEDFLKKWIELAGTETLSSVNLNKLRSESRANSAKGKSIISAGKENKSSKKTGSKTSKKSSSKKSASKTNESNKKEKILNTVSIWMDKLQQFGGKIENLDLNDNAIYDEGLQIILHKLKTKNLQSLALKNTKVTSKSKK